MARMRNQKIYSTPEHLQMLADEQENYIGRPFKLDLKNGVLTIFALPPRKVKKKQAHERVERNKREEKFERRA